MGTGVIENAGMIDETFTGLSHPRQRFDMGRPDLLEERPGDTLVEAVRQFEREGGFQALAEERNIKRREAQAPDVRKSQADLIDVSLPNRNEVRKTNDLAEE